jgi:hypothetical protein
LATAARRLPPKPSIARSRQERHGASFGIPPPRQEGVAMNAKLRWAAALLLATAPISIALAQSAPPAPAPCGPRDAMIKELGSTFNEKPTGRGLMLEGAMLELFTSPEGTWTVLITNPNKTSCLATAGEAWEPVEGKGSATNLNGSESAVGTKSKLIGAALKR